MAEVRIVKITRDTILSWGKPFYDFLQKQDPKDYGEYLLPVAGGDRDYATFASKLASLATDQDLALNDNHVPTDYWLILVGNFIIGTAKTRYILDQILVHEGGHIRLGLAPEYRGQGYGHKALELLLEECRRNHCLYDVMMTTRESNSAAIKLIEACGGALEAEVKGMFLSGKVKIFWIRYPVTPKVSEA